MKKNRFYRVLSSLIITFMLITQLPGSITYATTEVSPIQVTLSTQLVDDTLTSPVKLTVSYAKFSDLGLKVTNDDPGVITPLHVLASYYMQVKGATKDNLASYIDVASGGWLNKIEGYEGAKDPSDTSDYWMFAVNNEMPADSNGLGYLISTDKLIDGDSVTIYGMDYPNTQYYAAFTDSSYSTGANVAVNVNVRAVNLYTFNTPPSSDVSMLGTTLKAYKDNKNGTSILLTEGKDYEITSAINKYGFGSVKFYNEGNYYLTAVKNENNVNVITRPYATVSVTSENEYKVGKDIEKLSPPISNITGTTLCTAIGNNYNTPIVWTSSDESLLKIEPYNEKSVQVVPQNTHLANDTTVTATAKMTLGNETREKSFNWNIVGSLFLKDIKIDGLEKKLNPLTNTTFNFPLTDAPDNLKITPILEGKNENLFIAINGETIDSGESFEYKVDKEQFSNKITIVVGRSDITAATKTYTITLCKAASELPNYTSYWSTAKHDNDNSNIVDALTPRSIEEIDTNTSWHVNLRKGLTGWGKWSYPIIVNNNIYIAVDKSLYKYDLGGKLLGTTMLDSTVLGTGYTGWLAYGEGMIFVPLGGGSVQAFNAADLTSLWKSSILGEYGQTSCPMLYKDGYLYTGVTNGSNKGVFGCIKVEDEDKSAGYEEKDPVWVFGDNNTDPSFYWAGATMVSDYIIVPCDTGRVYSIDMKKSIEKGEAVIVDTYEAEDRVRTSISHDTKTDMLYFPTGKTGILHAVQFNSKDGTFGESKTADLGGASNCTPVIYRDRLYVSSPKGIFVFNKATLEQIYMAEVNDIGVGNINIRHLTLSTAYSRESNDYEVYLYGYCYSTPGYVSLLKDSSKTTDSTIKLLHTNTESPQYSTSNIVVGPDGSLFYVNDSANLFCLKSKVTQESFNNEVISEVNSKIPSEITIDTVGDVISATKAYEKLSNSAKAQMNTSALVEAQKKVAQIIHSLNGISIDNANWYEKLIVSNADDDTVTKVKKSLQSGELVKLYNIDLQNILNSEEASIGENGITLTLPLVDMGKYDSIQIVHLKHDGTLEYLTPTIKDGVMTVTLSSLSPVGIRLYNSLEPSNKNTNNNSYDKTSPKLTEQGTNTKTADNNSVQVYLIFFIMSLIILGFMALKSSKKEA